MPVPQLLAQSPNDKQIKCQPRQLLLAKLGQRAGIAARFNGRPSGGEILPPELDHVRKQNQDFLALPLGTENLGGHPQALENLGPDGRTLPGQQVVELSVRLLASRQKLLLPFGLSLLVSAWYLLHSHRPQRSGQRFVHMSAEIGGRPVRDIPGYDPVAWAQRGQNALEGLGVLLPIELGAYGAIYQDHYELARLGGLGTGASGHPQNECNPSRQRHIPHSAPPLRALEITLPGSRPGLQPDAHSPGVAPCGSALLPSPRSRWANAPRASLGPKRARFRAPSAYGHPSA